MRAPTADGGSRGVEGARGVALPRFALLLLTTTALGCVTAPPAERSPAPPQPASATPVSSGVGAEPNALGVTVGPPSRSLVDTDGDGVPDNVDACPDQPGLVSEVARENGCARAQSHPRCDPEASPRVSFGAGSAKPLPAEDAMVKVLAETLKNHPEIVLVGMEGFAEPGEGSPSKLGMRRANAVADRLIALGVAPERITRAWGEGAPRTDCGGCPCRDIGRRIVELVILQRTDRGPVGQFSRPAPKP